ncbi:MAG: hypothetical protein NC320_06450 [Clostridium sp.]|nr:hypothetical protein [Clostridium sp.]
MKKAAASFTAILLMISFTACDSKEQKKLNAQWEAQASENAVSYIQEKYGFKADVVSADICRAAGFFSSSPTSDVIVGMEYDGRAFDVYINGENSNTDGSDSYQSAEIEAAMTEMLNKNIPGVRQVSLLDDLPDHYVQEFSEPLYSAYYDGDNLCETAKSGLSGFKAYYLQTDFSDESNFHFLDEYCNCEDFLHCEFISCRSEDAFDFDDANAKSSPVYCDNMRSLGGRTAEYAEYELHEFDNFKYYLNYPNESSEKNAEIKISKLSPYNTGILDDYNVSSNAEIASDAYHISADERVGVWAYFPAKDILNFDYDGYVHQDTRIFKTRYNSSGEKESQGSNPVSTVGDYATEIFWIGPGEGEYTFFYLYDPD